MEENKIAMLRHYASPYYDPVKAHEYYMRTRELKGRSTTSLNDEGKKIWAYTKNNIKTEKKAKIKEEQEKKNAKITELREKAEATREEITSKLKALNEQLSKEATSRKSNIDSNKNSELEEIDSDVSNQKESIDSKKTTEIERLMAIEIPSGLSKTERAKRIAERNEKIAKLRNDAKISNQAKSDKSDVRTEASNRKIKVSQDTKEEKQENTANAQAQRKQVSAELKTAVEAAREAYKVAKENLDSSYEEIYQAEFDKIASQYKKVKKTKSSSSSTKKSKPLSYYIRK